MASFAAFLEVKGQRYPLLGYEFALHQETDSLGRPASPTMGGTIDCVLSAPGADKSFLYQWMFSPTLQQDGRIVLMQVSPESTLKTISFFNAYCVGLQTSFMPGAGGGGSLQVRLRISSQRVAVGAIVHDNNWPLASHGSGQSFAQPVSYQQPQPKPKPKPGLVGTPPVGLPRVPPKPPTQTPRTPPRLPQIPRNVPALPLPHPVLVFLAALLGWHDAGVANEWEQKLPEKDERRYRELEAKRSKEIAQGGKLPLWEEEEFQALDKKKYPNGHSPHAPATAPPDDDLVYAPTPKHRKGGHGTYMDLDDQTATEVLRESIAGGKQRYGYYNGKIYEFQPDNTGGYHGYPVKGSKPPQSVLVELKEQGKISEAEYNRLRKGK